MLLPPWVGDTLFALWQGQSFLESCPPYRLGQEAGMKALQAIFGFFASDKTPDSSFYLTLLAVVGIIGQALATAASPQLIAIGTALVSFYTIGHKIAEALGAAKRVDPVKVAEAAVDRSLALSTRLPVPSLNPAGSPVSINIGPSGVDVAAAAGHVTQPAQATAQSPVADEPAAGPLGTPPI